MKGIPLVGMEPPRQSSNSSSPAILIAIGVGAVLAIVALVVVGIWLFVPRPQETGGNPPAVENTPTGNGGSPATSSVRPMISYLAPVTSTRVIPPPPPVAATNVPATPVRQAVVAGSDQSASTATAADDSPKVTMLVQDARAKEAAADLIAARTLYASALAASPSPSQRQAIASRLEDLSARTLLAPQLTSGETLAVMHEVQPGEYLSTIARPYNVPWESIKRVNRLPSDMIQAGQKLKVVRGPLSARIIKSRHVLELRLGDVLVKTYPVAIGSEDKTPVGTYAVLKKLVDPPFTPPPSQRGIMKPKEGGSPDNPLGSRWIDIGDHLGIHGTNEPDSIGKSVSLGCVRMHNADVEFVYDFLVPGASKVEIVE